MKGVFKMVGKKDLERELDELKSAFDEIKSENYRNKYFLKKAIVLLKQNKIIEDKMDLHKYTVVEKAVLIDGDKNV